MPKATVSTEAERFDLKSAPPDGFIVLKRMSYGDMLKRRDMAAKVMMEGGKGRNRAPDSASMEFAQAKVFLFELGKCVVEHNLEDDNGQIMNLSQEGTLAKLDPRIGAEVEELISNMNQFEEDLEGNS